MGCLFVFSSVPLFFRMRGWSRSIFVHACKHVRVFMYVCECLSDCLFVFSSVLLFSVCEVGLVLSASMLASACLCMCVNVCLSVGLSFRPFFCFPCARWVSFYLRACLQARACVCVCV